MQVSYPRYSAKSVSSAIQKPIRVIRDSETNPSNPTQYRKTRRTRKNLDDSPYRQKNAKPNQKTPLQ